MVRISSKSYRTAYDKLDESAKEVIGNRAEFYELVNEYQIDNFWQLSGINATKQIVLNESVVAGKTTKSNETVIDPLVEAVRNKMKTYN